MTTGPQDPGSPENMPQQVVGVRFRRAGKVYFFDPADMDSEVGEWVVVETSRGLEVGWVVVAPKQVADAELSEPVKPVKRRATPEDLSQAGLRRAEETQVLPRAAAKVRQLGLPMKLLAAEYNLDGTLLSLSFSAEDRVDFRELVREMASEFHTRVELRQVGPRDKAKLVGGLGRCGRPLCCASYLCEFRPVSIRMAKDQDLPLNPAKISGVCGRLLCCLSYEVEQYRQIKEQLPKVGQEVHTPSGMARVVGVNVLRESIMARLESEAVVEIPVAQLVTEEPEEAAEMPKRSRRRHRQRRKGTDANANT